MEVFKEIIRLIPPTWQYPDITGGCITFEDRKYKTRNFKKTKWMQRTDIIVNNKKAGLIEICYLEERPERDEGPFLKEEEFDKCCRCANRASHRAKAGRE